MSDIKRATLSFNSQKVDDRRARDFGRTVRIRLTLPESNEDTYPEYNYKEELAAAKKKEKVKNALPTTNGLDPFNEDDDDVRRIAQEMEAKYGVSGPKKRRKGRRDDYADIGMGYDESDSFIDNTDGYDEMIPQNVTTVLGGFYINSGELEFKAVDEASSEVSSSSFSEDEEEEMAKSNGVKRPLSTDSEGEKETENDVEPAEKKAKLQSNGDVPKMVKKKLFTPEKLKEMKKRKEEKKKSATVKELLKEKRNETNNLPSDERIAEKSEKEESKDSMKENKKPLPIDNISDIIESVVKSVDDSLLRQTASVEPKPVPDRTPGIQSDSESSQDASDLLQNVVKLPENLPNEIVEIVDKIKELASKTTEGKIKFFSRPVNQYLLRLERSCKCLGKQSRLKIYEHLSPFVKCKKDTLIKRAKNLMLEEEERKLKVLIDRLKMDIENTMPGLLLNYERESQIVMQKKFSRESLINEDNKQLRMPKRKFSWTEDMKKLVKDIAGLRKKCFILEGRSKDKLEALMVGYLKSDIQVLWPEGWMSMTVLQKLCSNVLTHDVKRPPNNATLPQGSSLSTNSDIPPSKEIQMLSANTNLSITPIIPTIAKSTENPISVNITKSDITINKIENPQISPSGSGKVASDMAKSSTASLTITPAITPIPAKQEKPEKELKSKPDKEYKPKLEDFIIIDETPPRQKIEMKLDFGKKEVHHEPVKKADDCQIIDLTDQMTAERRKTQKHKPKYYEPVKEEYPKSAIEDVQSVPQNLSNKQHSSKNEIVNKHDFARPKSTEGDDIQKVMEDLKVLQKMSSPVKASESLTSSPVSVIAYNKSYSPKNMGLNAVSLGQPTSSHRNDFNKSDFVPGFQDVFQRQLYGDFSSLLANPNHSTPTSSKSHYNSTDKYVHSSSPGFINDKYYQGSNNNFPQNSSKIKNHPQQPGSCTILDDMFANFLTEYGYPKTGHLPKQSQK